MPHQLLSPLPQASLCPPCLPAPSAASDDLCSRPVSPLFVSSFIFFQFLFASLFDISVPYTCHSVYIRLHLQVDPHPFLFGSPARYAFCLVCLLHNKLKASDPLLVPHPAPPDRSSPYSRVFHAWVTQTQKTRPKWPCSLSSETKNAATGATFFIWEEGRCARLVFVSEWEEGPR